MIVGATAKSTVKLSIFDITFIDIILFQRLN